MTGRYQQPFKKPAYQRTPLPMFVIEQLGAFKSCVYKTPELMDDSRMFAKQNNFVHIPEAPVVEVGGAYAENLVINQ